MKRWIFLTTVLATACGGGSSSSTTATDEGAETSGSESVDSNVGGGPRTAPLGDGVIAVPVTGVPRADLRPELQELFVRVENLTHVEPPPIPEASTEDAIGSYISGPFQTWTATRVAALRELSALAGTFGSLEPVERAFAVALVAYAYEDTATSIRGMPLPAWLEGDPELMRTFQDTIDGAIVPIAELSATAYDGCVNLFTQAADPAWSEWPGFCQTRLDDLREVFGRFAR